MNCNPFSIAFSHYLIRKAILSTIIPAKKERINALLVSVYESKLNESNITQNVWRSPFLQLILIHLLELPNQEMRKLKYLLFALEGAAKLCYYEDGIYYSKLILNLIEHENCSYSDKVNYHKYMSLLYSQHVYDLPHYFKFIFI